MSQFTISGTSVKDYKLVLREDPNGLDVGKYGKLALISKTDNTVTYQYQHPNIFPESVTTPFQIFKIDVFKLDNGRDALVDAVPLYVYRAPVLMIHGIWSEGASFNKMKGILATNYTDFLLKSMDYKATNGLNFADNFGLVEFDGINPLLNQVITNKVAVSSVDIVTHSMGGLLTRLFYSGSRYKEQIHKVISINTPYGGTQVANFLLDENNPLKPLMCFLAPKVAGGGCSDGAASDFQVNSQAIRSINTLDKVVPTHFIATTHDLSLEIDFFIDALNTSIDNIGPVLKPIEFVCNAGLKTIVANNIESRFNPLCTVVMYLNWFQDKTKQYKDFKNEMKQILNELYNNEQNDLVVPLSSQTAGENSAFITSRFEHQIHSGAMNNDEVISRVKVLLGLDPQGSYFKKTPIKAPLLQYRIPPTILKYQSLFQKPTSPSARIAAGTSKINLVLPLKGATIAVGRKQEFKIESSSPIARRYPTSEMLLMRFNISTNRRLLQNVLIRTGAKVSRL